VTKSKRPYRLGKREASVAETRRRILEAAGEEYAVNGISGTSMQAVARRAVVAPGTVLYHFPDPDALAQAVVDGWRDAVRLPTPQDIDGNAPVGERLRVLIELFYAMYQRSDWVYQVARLSEDHPVIVEATRVWEDTGKAMLDKALGEYVDDARTAAVVGTLLSPSVWLTLSARGLSNEQAMEVAGDLARLWVEGIDQAR
jgi:AcrR family transcriptional regulator